MTSPRPAASADLRLKPLERFLGPAEASGGPFALLGVSPHACTDELVLSGLDRQVERINRHAECDTPEADEVRLALHAAAAQLLDPVVRRHLVSRWGGVAAAKATEARREPAPLAAPARKIDAQRLLEADAILTLGLFGGWNQRALRRLVSLAHRRGLSNRQVAETIRSLSRRRGRARPAAATAPRKPTTRLQAAVARPVVSASEPTPEQTDPAQKILRNALILGVLAMGGLAAAVIGIILATRQPPPGPPAAPSSTNANAPSPPAPLLGEVTPAEAKSSAKARPLPPPPDAKDLASIPREIGACTEAISIDSGAAMSRLESVIAKLAAHWAAIPRDALISSHDAIVEFLYRSGTSPEIAERAVATIARHAGAMESGAAASPADIAPSVWSVGMLARLGRERDLTATAKNAIDTALAAIVGPARAAMEPSFESGAGSAINAWPQKFTTGGPGAAVAPLDAWQAWANCAVALAGPDVAASQRFLLAGVETLLVQGPEPNENRAIAAVVAEIIARVTWRAEDDSRKWLLRWFADRRISSADLNAVTSTIATKSGAEGVDLTMVLSTAASENTRAELRERYATVWGVQESLARDEQITEWAKLARDAINAGFVSASEADDLAAAVVLARLNDAAWWQWRGDGGEAMRLMADIRGPVDQAMQLTQKVKGEEEAPLDLSDGAWAEKYLGARNAPKVRRDLLERLGAAGAIGPTDAEVLVWEAMTGSPQDVRNAAQDVVKKFAESASVLNAVLERLPRVPRTAAAAELVGIVANKPLPGFRDPDWPMTARRAIVERLLEALAAESPRVRIDRLSVLVAASYRSMAAAAPIPVDQRYVRVQPPAYSSAVEVWRKWRSAADRLVPSSPPPMTLDQIDRRRLSRQSQARGMVQAFAAEQASVAEIMGYVVACEVPTHIEQVRLVMTTMAADRRRAGNVLEQVKVSERAISQLWLIRFQQEPAS